MKKVFVAISIALVSVTTYAQKGTTQIGVGADVGIPVGDFADEVKTGFGGYAKGLFGIGEAGQITITSGYSSFKAKGSSDEGSGSLTIIPLLAGYRHNFSGFYAEPQIGYNIYGAKVNVGGLKLKTTEGGLGWAVGFGYVVNNVDLGIRYQGGKPSGVEGENPDWGFVGIHVGYNFSLSGK